MIATLKKLFQPLSVLDGVPLLLLRIYLAPIFIYAGYGKLQLGNAEVDFLQRLTADPGTAYWFGSLGLPFPELMAFLAGWTELIGGWLLLFGLLTRLISIPLMATMVVAAVTAHWDKGWHALPESKLTAPWEWNTELIEEAEQRRSAARSLLKRHGNYDWLIEAGPITVLKNGIEFAATYFIMLMVLFFYGPGRGVSLDYWLFARSRPD